MINDKAKTCGNCKKTMQLSLFHLKGKDSQGNPRHQSICKTCANSKRVKRYKQKSSKKSKKTKKSFDFSSCNIELIPSLSESKENINSIMSNYIESIYASEYTTN